MRTGDLRDRIRIYNLVTSGTPYGDTHIEYHFRCTCRARVNYSSGNRTVDNDAIFYSVDRQFIVRSYVPVNDTDIIVWNDQYWRVLTIDHNKTYNDIIITTEKIEGDNLRLIG